jgi:hypothetical protein
MIFIDSPVITSTQQRLLFLVLQIHREVVLGIEFRDKEIIRNSRAYRGPIIGID